MFNKQSFIEASKKIPFKTMSIDGLGNVGIKLMRDGELQPFMDMETNKQIAELVISEDGERVFSDNDLELVKGKFARAQKMDLFEAWRKANRYEESHEQKKSE